ncbi:MAG: peptidase M24, partial [Actinomycetes bacterium]
PTGYMPRDFPAHEKNMQVIKPGNAIAWNPSAEGLKVEDTLITNENDFDFITLGAKWPTVDVSGRRRPAIQEIL